MRTKVLGALSIGFAFGTGVVLGIALPILFIWRIFTSLHKTIELAETGTRVMATVTRIATYQVGPAIIDTSGVKDRGTFSRKIYRLSARWQHPETRKVYTLRGMVKDPSKFPVGSSVPFLVDYDNPRWHRMEDLGGGQTSGQSA
jgi:hypothetical protein